MRHQLSVTGNSSKTDVMAQSSAQRMKRHRARKAQGIVVAPRFLINPNGIKLLAENGWLAPNAPIDKKNVGDALLNFINASLKASQDPKQKPNGKFRQAVRSLTTWLL